MGSNTILITAVLVLFRLVNLALAADTPTSFCKCTCFKNSTIIPLSDSSDSASLTPNKPASRDTILPPADEIRGKTCADCNRQFCLSYNLPICRNAKESDIFTTCFQRDSVKDRVIVTLFLVATLALLAYAAVRPCLGRVMEKARERGMYRQVADELPEGG